MRRFLLALVVVVSPSLALAQSDLVSVATDSDQLFVIDPNDASTSSSVTITLPATPGAIVEGGNGLAVHPISGELYAILKITGIAGRRLCILDPVSGEAADLGNMGGGFAGIAFDCEGNLLAVSGDGAPVPESLFSVDLSDASTTLICSLGNGDDGETIAYNPEEGALYHASGHDGTCVPPCDDGVIFERVDDTGSCLVTNVDISQTALIDEEAQALTWWPDMGMFLWKQDHGIGPLFLVSADGATVELMGEMDHQSKGLAFVSGIDCFPTAPTFIRGDVDGDGQFVGLVDALYALVFQFQNGPVPPCFEAADVNDDGSFSGLVDAIYILAFQFQGGPQPPSPSPPNCGVDPDAPGLGCVNSCP